MHLPERRTSICSMTVVHSPHSHILCILILSYHLNLAIAVSHLQTFILKILVISHSAAHDICVFVHLALRYLTNFVSNTKLLIVL